MDCEESAASYPVNPTVGTELGAAPSSQKALACTMKIQPRAGAMVQWGGHSPHMWPTQVQFQDIPYHFPNTARSGSK